MGPSRLASSWRREVPRDHSDASGDTRAARKDSRFEEIGMDRRSRGGEFHRPAHDPLQRSVWSERGITRMDAINARRSTRSACGRSCAQRIERSAEKTHLRAQDALAWY